MIFIDDMKVEIDGDCYADLFDSFIEKVMGDVREAIEKTSLSDNVREELEQDIGNMIICFFNTRLNVPVFDDSSSPVIVFEDIENKKLVFGHMGETREYYEK